MQKFKLQASTQKATRYNRIQYDGNTNRGYMYKERLYINESLKSQ